MITLNSSNASIDADILLSDFECMKYTLSSELYIRTYNDVIDSVAPITCLLYRYSRNETLSQFILDYYNNYNQTSMKITVIDLRRMLFLDNHKFKTLTVYDFIYAIDKNEAIDKQRCFKKRIQNLS